MSKPNPRIEVLEYSIKTTTSLSTKIHLEQELIKLKDSLMKQPKNKRSDIEWTSYLACAYFERFCEGENATSEEQLEALNFIFINNLHKTLQGFYGRSINNLIETGIFSVEGDINWNWFDDLVN